MPRGVEIGERRGAVKRTGLEQEVRGGDVAQREVAGNGGNGFRCGSPHQPVARRTQIEQGLCQRGAAGRNINPQCLLCPQRQHFGIDR